MAKVIVYSTPTCPYCKKAKEYFTEKNVEFEDIDVSENEDRQKEMVDKSEQMAVPVIDIDGTIIVGFDKGKIDEALEKRVS
jgi:glutaredoxin-like YruB-family protein